MPFVSRAGDKLAHALDRFGINVTAASCADFGSNTGGFVDCLLQRGATRVYAIDTGYGVLDWKLRNDPRVVVMERTNAIHVQLPQPVDLVTIDVAWTKQRIILPAAARALLPTGGVVTLIKPHYEAQPKMLRGGVLPSEHLPPVIEQVQREIATCGFELIGRQVPHVRGVERQAEIHHRLPGGRQADLRLADRSFPLLDAERGLGPAGGP